MGYIENKIKKFIHLVKKQYGDISIGYLYDDEYDFYGIWHTYTQYHSEEFRKVIGKYIRICFFENDIFNISVAYDINKDIETKRKYTSFQHIVPNNISFNKMPEKKQGWNYIIKRDNYFVDIYRNIKIDNPKQKVLLVNMEIGICKVSLGAAA